MRIEITSAVKLAIRQLLKRIALYITLSRQCFQTWKLRDNKHMISMLRFAFSLLLMLLLIRELFISNRV